MRRNNLSAFLFSFVLPLVLVQPAGAQVTDGEFNSLQINEDLTVDGESWLGQISYFGRYSDGGIAYPTLRQSTGGDSEGVLTSYTGLGDIAEYLWNSSLDTKMVLCWDNQLALYELGSNNETILLNPNGDSLIHYDLLLNGTDNQMPNQTIVGDGSILNVGLADDRYAPIGPFSFLDPDANGSLDSFSIGSGNNLTIPTNGYDVFAIGSGNIISNIHSTAIGKGNNVSAAESLAVGSYNAAYGYHSQAYGWKSRTTGHGAIAFGAFTWSGGYRSLALGHTSVSLAENSITLGHYIETRTNGTTVLGQHNIDLAGTIANWRSEDPLLIVGNGQFTQGSYVDNFYPYPLNLRTNSTKSNALVVYKDGRMDVIAHASAPNGPIFSVKDGSADPANPITKMSVSKDGSVTANSIFGTSLGSAEFQTEDLWAWKGEIDSTFEVDEWIFVGSGNDYVEFEPNYSIIGDWGLREVTPSGAEIPNFAVGAGDGDLAGERANAMAVRKDGDVDVAGALRVPPAGDLSMGSFTAGRDPREALDPNEILPSATWGEEQL